MIIEKLTIAKVTNYLINQKGVANEDVRAMIKASRAVGKRYNVDPKVVFSFVVESPPLDNINTQLYDFDRRKARDIKYDFEYEYYKILNN